jgi:phage tail sheath protein FI
MPVTPTYPGIYIQELPSTVHTITAAPTNIAVFIGYTHPFKTLQTNWGRPIQIFGFSDYTRNFGGFFRSQLFANSAADFADMAQAVNQFFLNGGTEAYVVALPPHGSTITASTFHFGSVTFTAREITDETYQLTITVDPNEPNASPPIASPPNETADIIIIYGPRPTPGAPQPPPGTITETYRRVSLTPTDVHGAPDPNYIATRIGSASNPVSALVTVPANVTGFFPSNRQTLSSPSLAIPASLPSTSPSLSLFSPLHFTAVMEQDTELDKLAIFNLMIIPGVVHPTVMSRALAFCENKRAFLIMDPPNASTADTNDPTNSIQVYVSGVPKGSNAALYFPYLKSPDPLTGATTIPGTQPPQPYEIPPSATVAGIFAATDLSRGVWKAPAGFQAITQNTTGVVDRGRMTDQRQGVLNPLGVNCLRDFPNIGTVVFGARTTVTNTDEQWRYVPVRRMALFLEQTLYANLGWVVFEPNAEPLWTAIRMSITAFMLGLFRQNAFAGITPSQAFFVRCDNQTTTPEDVNNGIVNIVVGFAPLKPAEFVIITITQIAGQTQTA